MQTTYCYISVLFIYLNRHSNNLSIKNIVKMKQFKNILLSLWVVLIVTFPAQSESYIFRLPSKNIELTKCNTHAFYAMVHSDTIDESEENYISDNTTENQTDLKDATYISYYYFTNECDTIIILPKIGIKASQVVIDKIMQNMKSSLKFLYAEYGIYYFDCNVSCSDSVLELMNKINKYKSVEWCWPDTYSKYSLCNPLYNQQYYLNNTGQNGGTAGVDINVEEAWNITKGDSTILVAIIDTGVDRNHEDLSSNISPYGYTCNNPNGDGSPVNIVNLNMAHGTACAGIVAAVDNNLGIVGVAPNVKILPVNIYPNATNNSDGGATDMQIKDAIMWAADRADVISMSFTTNYNPYLEQAINYATTYGRNGKGCIVVVAAGNSSGLVEFPASMSNVIAVGAINKNGTLQNYSCKGDNLNLVAPSGTNGGLNGDIITTDITGNGGYYPYNYTNTFGGTSAACPQVAGVAALMLSTNRDLNYNQVMTKLQENAEHYGTEPFNFLYGYGRVNAGEAVNACIPNMQILGNRAVRPGESSVFYVSNLPSNMRVLWRFCGASGTYTCEQDVPNYNYCRFTNNGSYMQGGPLVADVYLDTVLIKTLSISLQTSFTGTFFQESCAYYGVGHPAIPSQTLTPEVAHFVHQGCRVHLKSDFFIGQSVTYSGVSPELWSFWGTDEIIFTLPLGSGGIPFQITLNPNGTSYEKRFLFFSIGNNGNSTSSLNVETISDREFLITVSGDERLYKGEQNRDGMINVDSWIIEAYNMNNGTKTFGQQVCGNKYILNTTDWQSGNYIIRAVVDGDILTEKIIVR